MDEPRRHAPAAITNHPFAVDPVAASGRILDLIIIAQTSARWLAPPFRSDPLGPRDAGDVVHGSAPDEAAGQTFRGRIDDRDGLGPVEQALGSAPPLPFRGGAGGGGVLQTPPP